MNEWIKDACTHYKANEIFVTIVLIILLVIWHNIHYLFCNYACFQELSDKDKLIQLLSRDLAN
jgi:hypothetical protein